MIVFPVSFIKSSVSTFSSVTFTTVGTTSWVAPTGVTAIEYLVVAGGGGGGNGYDNAGGGGGGAGMVLTGTLSVTPGNSYAITVGDGGEGGANTRTNNAGSPGDNSVLDTITALGGGAGQGSRTGGSVGAAQISNTTAPTGGTGTGGGAGGKGGGGATGAGSANSGTTGGAGGAGLASSLSGTSVTYGIGGAGANSGTQNGGAAGSDNTGNGGQAGGATSANSVGGGKGGSGIVIIVNRSKGTLANPGISAQDILNSGLTTSGWYYIQTSTMTQARQVYCNMTDEGGGWMLIGYTPSFNGTSGSIATGLGYPNAWENGEGTFNRFRVKTMDLWFHNNSAQCTQVMKMATATYNQIPLLDNMTIANKVVYANPSNLSLSTVSNYPAFVNNTPMTGTWYPVKGHTSMNTSLAVNAPGDWIYQASVWWTTCGPSTELQAQGRSGNAQGTGSWTNPSSNALYGMSNVTAATNSLRSDIQSYAVYIK